MCRWAGRPSSVKTRGERQLCCCPLLAAQAQPAQGALRLSPRGPRRTSRSGSPAHSAREGNRSPEMTEGVCSRSGGQLVPSRECAALKSGEPPGYKAGQAVWGMPEKGFLSQAQGRTLTSSEGVRETGGMPGTYSNSAPPTLYCATQGKLLSVSKLQVPSL